MRQAIKQLRLYSKTGTYTIVAVAAVWVTAAEDGSLMVTDVSDEHYTSPKLPSGLTYMTNTQHIRNWFDVVRVESIRSIWGDRE